MGSQLETRHAKLVRDAQARIGEQKARLQNLITRGSATQAADDVLAALYVELGKLKRLRLENGDQPPAGKG